jgi:tetratricopeptide (TPR) repeat protein
MKTLLTIFTIIFLFNIYTFAQRDKKTGGRGQESGRIERIERNQNNNTLPSKHPGTIESPPNKTLESSPKRPPRREPGIAIEGDYQYCCPEMTPTLTIFIDDVYQLSPAELANQFFESGEFGKALLYLNQAIEYEPFNAELYFLRGKVYFELNDYIQAKRDFSTVNSLEPSYAVAYYYRGMTNLYLGDKRLAIEDFRLAASLGDTLAQRFINQYVN